MLTAAVTLVAVGAVARLMPGQDAPDARPTAAASAPAVNTSAAQQPTAASTVTTITDDEALSAVRAFLPVWRKPGTQQARARDLNAVASYRLSAALAVADPTTIPAPKGTTQIRSRDRDGITVEVPLSDGTTALIVVSRDRAQDAGRVLVSAVSRA